MSLPGPVLARLVAAGVMSERHTTRRPQARRCPRCGRGMVSGLDADVAGLDVDLDPVPLSPVGEAALWLLGWPSWGLPSISGGRIEWRTPASPRRPGLLVLPEHRCRVIDPRVRA